MRWHPDYDFWRVRRWLLLRCAVVIVAVAATGGLLSSAEAAAPGFVTRSGANLELDGKPYRFTGVNVYNANNASGCWYPLASGPLLDDSFTAMGDGVQVIRSWFFQALATSGGARDWSGFDHTLAVAAARRVRVIVTLGNQWPDCDGPNAGAGIYKNKAWYQTSYKQLDPAGTVSYRAYVAEIVARYKDNPTILAWQLMNEAEDSDFKDGPCSPDAGAVLKLFAQDVSGLIKSIDPNHLVSLGTIGSGQCGAGSAAQYRDLHSIDTIDLCEFHDYGSPTTPMPGDIFNGLQNRIDQCNTLDKPLFVGEVGIDPATVGGFQGRADAFAAKLAARREAGVAGELLWAWNAFGSRPDGYDMGPGDPALDVLSAGAVEQFVGQSGSPVVDPAFAAATSGHVVQQFDFDNDGLVDGQPVTNQYAAQGVTFVGLEARESASFSHSPPFGLQQQGYNTSSFTGNFSYLFSPPAASVGFFWNDDEADTDVIVTTSDGTVREFRLPRPTGAGGTISTFYGYASPADTIARIDFDPQESGLQITDDMRVGVLPPVNDTTAPTITVNTPWDGAVFPVGKKVEADFVCADAGGSRLASCSGTLGNGQLIDTSSPGTKQFTVTATDVAGNSWTLVRPYTVVPADANGDGIEDSLQPSGTPAGSFSTVVPGKPNPTTGTVESGTVTVVDALDVVDPVTFDVTGKGVRITAVTDAVVSVCGPPSAATPTELDIPAGFSLTVTCGSVIVEVEDNALPEPSYVTVRVPGTDTSVQFPAGTAGTVNATANGGVTVTDVSGEGVKLSVGSAVVDVEPGPSLQVIQGSPGSDKLTGTAGADAIFGKGGNDTIDGKGGNDKIDAGPGNDAIKGGAGNDTIDAGSGNDAIDGGADNDKCTLGGGKDSVKNCETVVR